MSNVDRLAPTNSMPCQYDRKHLALYAALLDANDAGRDWQWAATSLMGIDSNSADAEVCWRSHLNRARWIVDDGLKTAITLFGIRPARKDPS